MADHQRWYTAQGSATTGQLNAALTIYQNTDGNFNALPVTNAQVVGTATLSVATCTSGQLAYSFSDGSGRTGTIPLTRLTQNVTCAATTPFPTNTDFAHSGNWYAAATAGQGFAAAACPGPSPESCRPRAAGLHVMTLSWWGFCPGGPRS